jgi:hypothetical protein
VKSTTFFANPLASAFIMQMHTSKQSILSASGQLLIPKALEEPEANMVSMLESIALYGLLVFYGLTADELKGRRPLAKFLCIKLIVMFTFYQAFVVSGPTLNQGSFFNQKSTTSPVWSIRRKGHHGWVLLSKTYR